MGMEYLTLVYSSSVVTEALFENTSTNALYSSGSTISSTSVVYRKPVSGPSSIRGSSIVTIIPTKGSTRISNALTLVTKGDIAR